MKRDEKEQLERRLAEPGLRAYERAEIVLLYAPFLRKPSKRRWMTLAGCVPPGSESGGACDEPADIYRGRTRERLARLAGVSHGTLDKVKFINTNGDEAIKAKVRRGELSIHRAFVMLRRQKNAWRMGKLL